jgi:excisionase family DNA binding protein
MSTTSSEGEILTIKQVADYLRVTERTIYRLAAARKIPAFKVGGTWRFSRADIDSWIRQQSSMADQGGDAPAPGTGGRRA